MLSRHLERYEKAGVPSLLSRLAEATEKDNVAVREELNNEWVNFMTQESVN